MNPPIDVKPACRSVCRITCAPDRALLFFGLRRYSDTNKNHFFQQGRIRIMSVIVEVSVFPMDKGVSVSPFVARVVKIIESSGLPYELNPMGTCIEGEWPEVLRVVDLCF